MEKLKYSLSHEKIILGTMLTDKDIRKHICLSMQSGEFQSDIHKAIFAALQTLNESGLDYTAPTLMTLVVSSDWGGKEYLEELEKLSDKKNITHHIERMRWDITRIKVYESLLPELVSEIKDPRSEVDDSVVLAERVVDSIKEAKTDKYKITGNTAAAVYSASLRARQVLPTFRSSGYPSIDKKLVVGFAKGKITVICGTSSSGKSTFSLNTAKRQAKTWKVGILPWESGMRDALDIMASSELKIPLDKFEKLCHMMTDEEQKNIDDYIASLLDNENISFLKPPPKSITKGNQWEVNDRILDWVEGQIDDWGKDIIYWDLFEKRLRKRDPESITNALERVQEFAAPDRLNVHMVLLHQINLKTVERRQDERPTRDSLKGTGSYIEVPDLVLALYRPAIYERGIEDNIIEITCLKQRKGPWPWKIVCKWNGMYGKVSGGREVGIVVTDQDKEDYRNGI